MLAKWILGGAFGIATKRVAAKHGRENYDVISLKETYLKGNGSRHIKSVI